MASELDMEGWVCFLRALASIGMNDEEEADLLWELAHNGEVGE